MQHTHTHKHTRALLDVAVLCVADVFAATATAAVVDCRASNFSAHFIINANSVCVCVCVRVCARQTLLHASCIRFFVFSLTFIYANAYMCARICVCVCCKRATITRREQSNNDKPSRTNKRRSERNRAHSSHNRFSLSLFRVFCFDIYSSKSEKH